MTRELGMTTVCLTAVPADGSRVTGDDPGATHRGTWPGDSRVTTAVVSERGDTDTTRLRRDRSGPPATCRFTVTLADTCVTRQTLTVSCFRHGGNSPSLSHGGARSVTQPWEML